MKGLASQLIGHAVLMRPTDAGAFACMLEEFTPEQIREGEAASAALRGSEEKEPYDLRGGVAHIYITGTIMRQVPKWFAYWGIDATSTVEVQSTLKRAVEASDVDSIMLHIGSPGGSLSGLIELADDIYAARKQKPVYAFSESMAASAAYWIGSQATRFTASPSSLEGSIGVYTWLDDYSEAYAQFGIKTHIIRFGEHKGVGLPGVEITDENLKAEQERINEAGAMFVDAVSRGRGMDRGSVLELATGEIWFAATAESKGLIDAVETRDAALEAAAGTEEDMPDAKDNKENTERLDRLEAGLNKTNEQIADVVGSMGDLTEAVKGFASVAKKVHEDSTKAEEKAKNDVVAKHQTDGRLTPALLEALGGDEYIKAHSADQLEQVFAALPKQTRPNATAGGGDDPADQYSVGDDDAKFLSRLGVTPVQAKNLGNMRSLSLADRALISKDGAKLSFEKAKAN